MKILSFNVNGIKSFTDYIKDKYKTNLNSYLKDILKVDIACFQEMKTTSKYITNFSTMDDYVTFTNLNKDRNGIYGVSTFVRKNLYCRKHSINVPYAEEGRTLLTDHGTFKIFNVYFPFYDENGNKEKEEVIKFYNDIKMFIDKFDNIIICGDFNAVYSPYDHFIYLKEYFKTGESSTKLCSENDTIITSRSDDDYISRAMNIMSCNLRHSEIVNKYSILQQIKDCYKNTNIKGDFQFYVKNFMSIYLKGKSRYFDYIYDTIKNLEIPKNIEEDSYFDKYRENLIEKRYSSRLELSYLLNTKKEVLGLMFSTYQRLWLLKLVLEMKYIDAFRLYSSEYHRYSCWNTFLNLRPTNQGTRIDYIFISSKLLKYANGCGVLSEIYGSDHCPVYLNLKLKAEGDEKNILNSKNNLLAFFNNMKHKSDN